MRGTDAADELLFVPLGGAGEIGMNLNLYGYGPPGAHRWLMVDCGVTFGTDGLPGVDVMMPDPAFIADQRDRLDGLVLTHAHEDHLGAVAHLWPQLLCPVYATPFALAALRRKLDEAGLSARLRPQGIPQHGSLQIGPFGIELIGMTHSIPEANAVVIRTPSGVVLHSGDWKLDPAPVIGPCSDEDALRRLGDEGVLALICDSTNVFEEGSTGSEGPLRASLTELIGRCERRVVVTCFATNVARLHSIASAAHANGRDVVMAGASVKRTYAAARECGYLGDLPPFLDDALGKNLPRDRTLVICTGGQGEPRAALSRLAHGDHPYLTLEQEDSVIFSSRVIPGNEPQIARVRNALLRLGVRMYDQRDGLVHVSGHPARDDLRQMYRLVRPRVAVPVHGELRHMVEHAALARDLDVPDVLVAENGTVVRLAPGSSCVVDHVPAGRLALDGRRTVPLDGALVRGRAKAIYNGAVVVTVVLAGQGSAVGRAVEDVQLSSFGLIESGEDAIIEGLCGAARGAVSELGREQFIQDDSVRETVRLAIRRLSRQLVGKRPIVEVHVVRL